MKTKLIFIIIFSFASVYSYTQTERKLMNSVELGINNHYLLSDTYNTDFNYGVSLLFNWSLKNLRFSTGINYSSFNWCLECKPYCRPDFLFKRTYKMKYWSIPMSAAYTIYRTDRFFYGFSGSIILSKDLLYYGIVDSYLDKKNSNIIGEKAMTLGFDLSYRIGPEFSYKLSENFTLRFKPYFEQKLLYNMKYIKFSLWEYDIMKPTSFTSVDIYYFFYEPKYVLGFSLSVDFLLPRNVK